MFRFIKSIISNRSPLRLGWHHGKAFLAALRYGFPARKLTVIGITGTDGKTTTVAMTAHILADEDIPSAALSTAFLRIKNDIRWNTTQKTSPSPFMIQRFLREAVQEGCTHAVLECSSHGLVQGRLDWTWPSVAAITNTSIEHLDYHGTMDQYRKDKGILFRMLRGGGVKVLNTSDETFAMYLDILSHRSIGYGPPQGNVEMLGVTADEIDLSIPGSFNRDNALCAIACATAVGVQMPRARTSVKDFPGVPGRMERIDESQPFSVFVDFTVTPAAYEKTLKSLREMVGPDHRILVLTGSCGDRMKEKRPIVGKICSERADVVVVSNEDPYTEDPYKIIDEVWAGIDQSRCEAHKIFDRREAIRFLLKNALPGDAVILCAKGSDTTMMTARGQIPWNEREIARELLRELIIDN